MRIELRADSVLIEGYVNAVARDSRPMRDRDTGQRFVEQIVPGAFRRALEQNEVDLLLDHDNNRKLGSTQTNLSLTEDAIGLKARAEITDPEVIQKAREKKLRGWSFGFHELDASEEDMPNGMKLVEVSLIDEKKVPCYTGTSIETRASGEAVVTTDLLETRAEYVEMEGHKEKVDYEAYRNRIRNLEKEM